MEVGEFAPPYLKIGEFGLEVVPNVGEVLKIAETENAVESYVEFAVKKVIHRITTVLLRKSEESDSAEDTQISLIVTPGDDKARI